jgi:hypothetical protein
VPANRIQLEAIARDMVPTATEITHLGTGGFACTFRVTDNGQTFALKVIDPGLSEAARVDRELAAIQRVHHPGVVEFISHGDHVDSGITYKWIRMAFVEGHPLGQAIAGGVVFSSIEAMRLVRSLVEAASAIWEQRTAHRDLSPGNILIRPDGTPVIVDLGLARHVDDGTITALPTPGTPGWMSPEQVGATPTHGDWRSDQFVIGALGYYLLTNVRPFYAPSLPDRWLAPALQTPQPVRAIDPNIPSVAADVIERMLHKLPHRRYLRWEDLLADLDRAIVALESSEVHEAAPQRFLVNIGQVKNFAEGGFLTRLKPDAVVIDIRAGGRVAEFVDAAAEASALSVIDPVSHFARSPLTARPAYFQRLAYGSGPLLTGFSDEASRTAWCQQVLDAQMAESPDVVISPYFFAGENEAGWVGESLACAAKFEELMNERPENARAEIWTGIAIHSTWLANDQNRDTLLTALTGQPMKTLYLLVATTQPPLGPLADLTVLRGFHDLLTVLREAGTPVVLGKRASSGLLLLALGADGWSTGVSGNLMNMSAHPEAEEDGGGQALPRIYLPSLLNLISVENYVLMRAARPDLVELHTTEAADLLAQNPDLENITTEQRVLLSQHNLVAQRAQVEELSALPSGQRIARLRTWVETAADNYRALPPVRLPSEGAGFLVAWADALA